MRKNFGWCHCHYSESTLDPESPQPLSCIRSRPGTLWISASEAAFQNEKKHTTFLSLSLLSVSFFQSDRSVVSFSFCGLLFELNLIN